MLLDPLAVLVVVLVVLGAVVFSTGSSSIKALLVPAPISPPEQQNYYTRTINTAAGTTRNEPRQVETSSLYEDNTKHACNAL